MKPIVDPQDFPASRNSTYLNAASVALMYQGAAEAVIDWQKDLAEYGTMHFDELAEEAVFENLRQAGAGLFRAQPEDIAAGSSATELMASIAWSLAPEAGRNIVGTEVVFPSTIYPWTRVAEHTGAEIRLARGESGYVRQEELLALIDDATAVVSISHVEYGAGQRYDLEGIATAAHEVGALLVVDATQSAGMLPIDVHQSKVDVMISGAYKWLCGPFGAAVMYIAPHLYPALSPGLLGWRSHKDMWDFNPDRLELPDSARRFEFSTMAYGCAIGLTKSIDYLLEIGTERVFSYTRGLADLLREGLRDLGANVLSPASDEERTAILAVQVPGIKSSMLAKSLDAEGVIISLRGDFVRFSPHLYNLRSEIERTLGLMDTLIREHR